LDISASSVPSENLLLLCGDAPSLHERAAELLL
jgi:hypothetical protein